MAVYSLSDKDEFIIIKTGLSPISYYKTKSDLIKSLEKVNDATVDSPSL